MLLFSLRCKVGSQEMAKVVSDHYSYFPLDYCLNSQQWVCIYLVNRYNYFANDASFFSIFISFLTLSEWKYLAYFNLQPVVNRM